MNMLVIRDGFSNFSCDRNTTFCLLTENKPAATRDVYTCICRESYYLPNSTLQGFRGDIVEFSEGFDNYSCIPCPAGCSNCDSNGVCLFGEDQEAVSLENLLKVSVGSVLGACILCCLVLSVIVFQQRKCKVSCKISQNSMLYCRVFSSYWWKSRHSEVWIFQLFVNIIS